MAFAGEDFGLDFGNSNFRLWFVFFTFFRNQKCAIAKLVLKRIFKLKRILNCFWKFKICWNLKILWIFIFFFFSTLIFVFSFMFVFMFLLKKRKKRCCYWSKRTNWTRSSFPFLEGWSKSCKYLFLSIIFKIIFVF